MKRINQKHMVPSIPGGKPFAARRSHFLDGTQKAYFGPGQRPDQGDSYTNPTDWPPAGMLLRVPQVVWLSLFLEDASVGPNFSEEWFNLDEGTGPFFRLTPNLANAEYQRVLAAFTEAKSTIAKLRPGKTWVEVVDFVENLSSFPFDDGLLSVARVANPVPAFFGTDFLNLYAGDGAFSLSSFVSVDHPYVGSLTTDPRVSVPIGQLAAIYSGFRGHDTSLYHTDLPWTAEGAIPIPGSGGTLFFEDFGGERVMHDADSTEFADSIANQYSYLGFSHPGSTELLTADSVVAAIAAHYGFDPATGKTLG